MFFFSHIEDNINKKVGEEAPRWEHMATPVEENYLKAYVMCTVQLGKTNEVLAALKKIPNITSVAVITGEYDIIVRVETKTMDEMYDRTQEIHLIKGIVETTTSVIQKEF